MAKITPHLWYDTEAREAAKFYVNSFGGNSKVTQVTVLHDTPSGDADTVAFELWGQPFMAISAGPYFTFNPTVSFMVAGKGTAEVDRLWKALGEGGSVLMPLQEYPFSEHYGWLQDKYGLSWQVGYMGEPGSEFATATRITPTLMFTGSVSGQAEAAVKFYTSVFPDSHIGHIMRYEAGDEPDKPGTVKHAGFSLLGQDFAAMDSARAHDISFNEAISLIVTCNDQAEIDRYWAALSAVPEAEQCGWLKDKYGFSWQISPAAMFDIMASGDDEKIRRVTQAFLKMKKFDLAELERAAKG